MAVADGGGLVSAVARPVEGGEQIARGCVDFAGRAPGLKILERTVNGQPGLVAQQDGVTVAVVAFDIAGDRIKHIWVVLNPERNSGPGQRADRYGEQTQKLPISHPAPCRRDWGASSRGRQSEPSMEE
jgi:hypothetical protein